MIWSHLILSVAWIIFCILHSVFASLTFKQLVKNRMGKQYRFYRLYYTIVAALSFAAVLVYLIIIPSYRLFVATTGTVVTGTFISLLGFTIMCICNAKYFMQVTGLKGLTETKTHNELMITGIHKFVRHPLYTGTFVFIWGLFIIFPSISALITDIIITTYTLIALRFEEQKLEKEFGVAYKTYKKKVPMLIPRIG